MNKFYTGVGSRKTPENILVYMKQIARELSHTGFTLRSGGASGADSAFESGAGKHVEIYLPWRNFNGHPSNHYYIHPQATAIARDIHPNWNACSQGAKKLHARNIHQVLGHDCKTPSKFVLCWTPNAKPVGGTRTAIICAEMNNIPVFNMADPEVIDRLVITYPSVGEKNE